MKIKSTAYPHPVLAEFNDDYLGSNFTAHLTEVTPEAEFINFKVEFELVNDTLQALIKNNKALFVAHIECNASMYRQAFTSTENKFSFVIPQKRLTKQIDVSFMVVANTTINNYKNELLHEDYRGVSISFKKGTYLAVDPGVSIMLEKDPLIATKSIFNLRESEKKNPDPFEIEFNEVIDILLPPEVYEQVAEIQRYEQFNPLLVMLYYLPALMDALNYINQILDSDEEYTEDYEWYTSILNQLEQLHIDPKKIDDLGASTISHKILKKMADEALHSLADLISQ